MKHLAVPYVFGSKSQVEFEITDLDQMEERLRKSGFIDPGNNHQRFLYVIAFAVMTAGDHVLVVEKSSGERVLGFGKPITWRPDIVGYNRRSFILQTLYDELDLYVPGSSYDIYQVALIHDAEHEYASLGCVFFMELKSQLRKFAVGNRILSMECVDDLRQGSFPFKGWSGKILDYLAAKEMANVAATKRTVF